MLDELPPELLDQILDHCDQASLKTLRQCNKHVAHRGTPFLYSHLHIGFFISSLHRCKNICSNPSLAKHVKKITFHPDILPSWTQFAWESHIDFRPPYSEFVGSYGKSIDLSERSLAWAHYGKLRRHGFAAGELNAGWLRYLRLQRSQRDWREHAEGLMFKEAISSLPMLQSVVLQLAKPFRGGRINDTPYWKSLAEIIFVGPDAWTYGSREDIDLDQWDDIGADEQPYTKFDDGLLGLPVLSMLEAIGYRASFSGVRPVQELEIDIPTSKSFRQCMGCNYREIGSTREHDPTNHDMRYNIIVEGFKPLKKLTLICPHAADDYLPGDPRGAQAEEVQELLRAASQLRTLELEYGDAEKKDYDDWREHFGLTPLFSNPTVIWPNLHDLSLTASIPSAPFINFLTLHGSTLKRLEMRDNVSDNWRAVLEAVPKVCKLEYVYLECLWQFDAGGGGLLEDEEDDDEGMYICHFDEGTDVDDPVNDEVKAFLLRGEGTLEM